MTLLLVLLAIAMMFTGGASVVFGAQIIVERGLGMVIAGTMAAAAGAVLLGLAVAAHRLRRIERVLAGIADGASDRPPVPEISVAPASVAAAPPAPMDGEIEPPPRRAARVEPAVVEPIGEPPPPPPPPASEAPDAPPASASAVVGRYESGGSAYVMYADGSIEADTPTGTRRFASMDELKSFAAANRGGR